MSPLKIIFAGTPEFAAIHLSALLDSEHTIVGVYTQPDRPAGRGKKLQASAVKQVAVDANIPVYQPQSLKSEDAQAELRALDADVMIVVAYGLLLPKAVLDTPRFGCINVHGSILPRWRGAAPIQRAIETGDTHSGITIMQMDAGLDTGPMLLKAECEITREDTAATLHDKLADIGPPALLKTLSQMQGNALKPEQQDDTLATYAQKLSKQEADILWASSADNIHRKIRAFNPFPVAYTTLNEERIRVFSANIVDTHPTDKPGTIVSLSASGLRVNCAEGQLNILELQLPGKKRMSAADCVNGFSDKFSQGTQLGQQ